MSTIPQGRLLAAVLLTLALVARAPAEELRLVFHVTEEIPGKQVKAYQSRWAIGPFYHASVIGDEREVHDCQAKRIYFLDQRTMTFKDGALHAQVTFKEASLRNSLRQMAAMRDVGRSLPGFNQINLEAVAGRRLTEDRNKPDAPMGQFTPRGDGWFWHHDGRTYVQFLPSDVVVPEACRRSFSQFLLHRCMIHPQARVAIEATGKVPTWLIYEVDAPEGRAFHAFRLLGAEVGEETWTELPAEYRRFVDPADPLATMVKQFEKARKVTDRPTRYDLRTEVQKYLARNDPVDAYLVWFEFALHSYLDRESAALIQEHVGQREDELQVIMKGFQGPPGHLRRYLEALETLEKKNPERKYILHVLRGNVLDMLGNPKAAIECYTKALQAQPYLPAVYQMLGAAHNRMDTMWRGYEMARELVPDHPIVVAFAANNELRLENEYPEDFSDRYQDLCLRGREQFDASKIEKAIATYTEAIQLHPDRALAYFRRGRVYATGKQDYTRAIADFAEAIARNPNFASAYNSRGVAHLQGAKDYTRAIADYRKAIQLDSHFANPHNNLAWLLATCPQDEVRNGEKAVLHAQRACELVSVENPQFLDTLAAAHAEQGNFEEAVRWSRKALATPGLSPRKMEEYQQRLDLYLQKRPYRMK
ncbi:MAG: tetratricopeptide repeat protein [Gemmataceae bacterium]